ncbi:MAG: hypothetical protein HY420_00970 [Candidatus Kerfeldbacteria bacterium]|nr:hypothetical protein [Candidatus Kerfeldbacteria bacterium]
MSQLDPKHELQAGQELLDLPPGHRSPGWSWLLAAVIASFSTFSMIVILLTTGMNVIAIAIVAPLIFLFTVFLVHAIAEQAR